MPSSSSRTESREQALCYLYEYSVQPDLSPSEIISASRGRDQSPSPYATLLFKTVLEHLEEVDGKIADASRNWSFSRISRITLAVLRLSVSEYLFIPDHPAKEIVINEALELARKYGTDESVPFINGVLGTLLA